VDYVRSYLSADENSSRHNGDISFSYTLHPGGASTGTAGEPARLPATALLDANFPNPFRSATTFRFYLAEAGSVRITIRDALGRTVGVAADGRRSAGWHEAEWSIASSQRGALPPGIYFAVFESGASFVTRKIMIME
jgi:hypothetical protein